MNNSSNPLLFFGNERLVSGLKTTNAPILTALIKHGYPIAAVVSHHSDGKSRNNRELEVARVAIEHNIPVLLPNKPGEIRDQLAGFGAEAAILVAYGRIIPQSVIDIFPKGIINVHPSLLPAYRGPTPIESAITRGDTQTGISIMQLTAGMDEGPVYAQTIIPLKDTETKFELYETVSASGVDLLLGILPSILDGTLRPTPQDNGKATYCQLLSKTDGQLDTTAYTAIEAGRRVRANLGFPKTKTKVLGHEIIITKAHATTKPKTPLDIVCRDGAYLSIDELVAPSGRHMNGEAFLRGYAA